MPSPGPSDLMVILAVGFAFLAPLYLLMKRGQRRYEQEKLELIERELDEINGRLK